MCRGGQLCGDGPPLPPHEFPSWFGFWPADSGHQACAQRLSPTKPPSQTRVFFTMSQKGLLSYLVLPFFQPLKNLNFFWALADPLISLS